MTISPTVQLVLRDMLGAEAEDIPDDMFQMVSKAVSDVRYLSAIQGDADQIDAFLMDQRAREFGHHDARFGRFHPEDQDRVIRVAGDDVVEEGA